MALIRKLFRITKDRTPVHTETDCGYVVFDAPNGERFLQLDSYGSDKRRYTGKVSQSLQFSETTVRELRDLIDKEFPALKSK
jgi:hypothetical protein